MKRVFYVNVFSISINEKKNMKTVTQSEFDYSLLTKLPRIIA